MQLRARWWLMGILVLTLALASSDSIGFSARQWATAQDDVVRRIYARPVQGALQDLVGAGIGVQRLIDGMLTSPQKLPPRLREGQLQVVNDRAIRNQR